jgi:uncharacterized cupin superfamily protein
MTFQLEPGRLIEAATVELEHEPLPAEQIVSGSPTTGILVLDDRDGRELGVWEMTPGVATDIETDEVFIVLAGRATVEGVAARPLELTAGAVVRLTEGMRTTWSVHETLRKVYLV